MHRGVVLASIGFTLSLSSAMRVAANEELPTDGPPTDVAQPLPSANPESDALRKLQLDDEVTAAGR